MVDDAIPVTRVSNRYAEVQVLTYVRTELTHGHWLLRPWLLEIPVMTAMDGAAEVKDR